MPHFLRTMLWRNRSEPDCEYCSLVQVDKGFRLEGVALLVIEHRPMRIDYQVTCDASWKTRAAEADVSAGDSKRNLRLIVDEEQRWWRDGTEIVDCRGLVDVDLSFSPSTNTLPIRRLDLAEGESGTTTAAWIRFPELDVQPFPQRYTRLSPYRYLFESLDIDYRAELAVDDVGLVTSYEGYWERIAADG